MEQVPRRRGSPDSTKTSGSLLDRFFQRAAGPNSEYAHIPESGFLISTEFERLGGLDGLLAICRDCPVNTLSPKPAGCAGTIYLPPDSPNVEKQLGAAIKRLGVRREISVEFLATRSLWYGLWARSPLNDECCRLLGLVLSDLIRQNLALSEPFEAATDPKHVEAALGLFIAATKIARERHVSLHVSMAPPGHTDFGVYTIFPHCPRCKAEANLKRWEYRPPAEPYTCKVCGQVFSPAATASSEDDRDHPDQDRLRQILGPARFREFLETYLAACGYTPAAAQSTIDAADAAEAFREKRAAEARELDHRRTSYLHTVLYAGLHPTTLSNPRVAGMEFFGADDFAELLHRCRKLGLDVFHIFHESQRDDLCESSRTSIEYAAMTFEEMRKKGRTEWFSALVGIPDHVLNSSATGAIDVRSARVDQKPE
jgi:hypothetical protein